MGNLLLAVNVLLPLLQQASTIGAMIQKAQAEGRDLTEAELNSIVAADDAAKAALAAAIAKARATP